MHHKTIGHLNDTDFKPLTGIQLAAFEQRLEAVEQEVPHSSKEICFALQPDCSYLQPRTQLKLTFATGLVVYP
jgi:hypothetical protein